MPRALIIHQGGHVGAEWDADPAEVLRTTPLLRVLAGHEVTWYTSAAAAPLLWGNPLVDRVILGGRRQRLDLGRERFDLVVNLEPTPGCCALADALRARRRAGYTWDPVLGRARLQPTRFLSLPLIGRAYQSWLFALIDRRWSGEKYVLGYRPRSGVRSDVGLYHPVAAHAPERAWPPSHWEALARRLVPRLGVSRASATAGLLETIEWVSACRMIVAGDSLGLHVALALEKPVVALFGPTDPATVPLYGLGVARAPRGDGEDMARISPADVAAAVLDLSRVRLAV